MLFYASSLLFATLLEFTDTLFLADHHKDVVLGDHIAGQGTHVDGVSRALDGDDVHAVFFAQVKVDQRLVHPCRVHLDLGDSVIIRKLDKIEDIQGNKTNIEWGAQIRSYVFMPYTLAKDNRTGFEDGNISAVMDGDIDGFINAYLKYNAAKNQ